MAWNEPGGNGKQRDPWGGGDQGPPDLDEALRKFRQKLGGVFGGGGGGNRRGAENAAAGVFGLVLLLVGALWTFMGVHQIDEQERAVVLRFGSFHEILSPGLNWNPWLVDAVVPVNVTAEKQYESRSLMLTQDEAIVELPIKVQYNIADVKAFVLNVDQPVTSLGHATDSALRHVVGSSMLDQALSEGRAAIGDEVRLKLQNYLDLYGTGIQVVKVTIQEAKPPPEVKAAFDDVIKAKEDEERLKNEAYAYANGIVPEARGRAQRQLEEAAAYRAKVVAEAEGEAQRFEKLLAEYHKAPEVTRERLYLDTLGRVYGSSNKVLVDISGGSNVLYLPIDRLAARGAGGQAAEVRQVPGPDVNQVADEVMERLRREFGLARTGETLMNGRMFLYLVGSLVLLVLVSSSLFVIRETERAVVLRFGKLREVDTGPGLHAKAPFIDEVRVFNGRVLTLDSQPESFYTLEKKRLIVDSFVKWRIDNVDMYYRATGGDQDIASKRLAARANDGLRNQFGKRRLNEVVSGQREELMAELTGELNSAAMQELGIRVIDVRVKKIDLPPEVSDAVYNRMSAEREKLAREYRSHGKEEAEKIRADADRQVTILEAEAYRDAERMRGEGDAKATAVYASAYEKDREFYAFTRSLRSYEQSFSNPDDVLVLDAKSDFFRYLGDSSGTAREKR